MDLFFYKEWRILSAVPEAQAQQLFDVIQRGHMEAVHWLKRHSRSDVMLFDFEGRKLVLKIPKEKNRRTWIRFTTLYRDGEAFRNLKSMDMLNDLGIPTTVPVMAAEKKSSGMVKDSWLVYEYLEGESCQDQSKFPEVVRFLESIHKKGYLHGDAQIRNFLYADKKIFAIDANPAKPLIPAYAYADELAYLARSAPETENYFNNKNSFLYRFAKKLELERRLLAAKKRKVIDLIKSLFK